MRKKTAETIPVLTEQVREILTSFSKSRSLPVSLSKRSTIVLLASEGVLNRNISSSLGMHFNSVSVWRNRFLNAIPRLAELETVSPEKLPGEIKTLLSDNRRPSCPPDFTPDQILKIIDLACKHPSEFGYETSQWSLNLLASEIVKQGIAEQISAKSVSRFFKMR